uniref:Uncharacterized protein n=1 Tax=Percolomonas cosmopolitus TaxID=63605 RepID=A0A7S1KQ04_9EUKA|eukprot:CAMPEP_0117444398 /NCGR_PEP_ID=MMETSP0759-20121206/5221_1 /TAXON_ID=63605 /ORGANISM="Percolomonas cosmopolitus, Strain WS" /LENGTH=429 /DNA_ID=CAMNT_0005236465 /DNA_START=175 /DNA_END=1464 /DNA_ORIENTATION=+
MPSAFPEASIPIIQARRQNALIKAEKTSLQKWHYRNDAYIKNLQSENLEIYGEKRHPIDVRLQAEFSENNPALGMTRKPLAKTSDAWQSNPDANRYYGYGIAPPGTRRDWEMQIARGAFDGKFERSINADGAGKSKYGKLTSSKRWMDYSGVRIFGKGHKDPLANDYTRFRSTPRAIRGQVNHDFAPPQLDADEDNDALSVTGVQQQQRDTTAFKSRKGALLDKYTDKTFGVSPLTSKGAWQQQQQERNKNGDGVHAQRPHSSAQSTRSMALKQNGRWKVPKRPGTAQAGPRQASKSSQQLHNLLELRRKKFLGDSQKETTGNDAESVVSSSASVRVTPRVEKTQDGRWIVKYAKKDGMSKAQRVTKPIKRARPASQASSRTPSGTPSARSRASSAMGRSRVPKGVKPLRLAANEITDDEVSLCTDASW